METVVPNNPSLRQIRERLNLEDGDLWARIRRTAGGLLATAGILHVPARDKHIQEKKREVANDLEHRYPNVFGVTPGSSRDFELQRTTSYAILTSAMLTAKREERRMQAHRKKAPSTRGKRRAETPPSWVREKRVRRAPPATRAEPAIRIEDLVAEVIQVSPSLESEPSPPPESEASPPPESEASPPPEWEPSPPPESEAAPPPEWEPSPPPESQPAAPPKQPAPPATSNNIVVIFSTEAGNSVLFSPMSWYEMVPPGGETPSLGQVYDNLVEDGLRQFNKYTLYNPEKIPVRSDRGLNLLLRRSLEKGVTEEEWTVVFDKAK